MPGKKIFIVDDDEIFLLIAKANLLHVCSEIEIVTASNGEEALQKISESKPNIVFLDINMPIMNGWEFLEALSGLPKTDSYEIFVTTSSVDPTDKRKAAGHPLVKGYIEKPLSPEKIQSLEIL